MAFVWVDPITKHAPRKPDSLKIAAVHIETDMIAHVFQTCIAAANKILREGYLNFTPSQNLIFETAQLISSAADQYHKEVLGYYWKWIH